MSISAISWEILRSQWPTDEMLEESYSYYIEILWLAKNNCKIRNKVTRLNPVDPSCRETALFIILGLQVFKSLLFEQEQQIVPRTAVSSFGRNPNLFEPLKNSNVPFEFIQGSDTSNDLEYASSGRLISNLHWYKEKTNEEQQKIFSNILSKLVLGPNSQRLFIRNNPIDFELLEINLETPDGIYLSVFTYEGSNEYGEEQKYIEHYGLLVKRGDNFKHFSSWVSMIGEHDNIVISKRLTKDRIRTSDIGINYETLEKYKEIISTSIISRRGWSSTSISPETHKKTRKKNRRIFTPKTIEIRRIIREAYEWIGAPNKNDMHEHEYKKAKGDNAVAPNLIQLKIKVIPFYKIGFEQQISDLVHEELYQSEAAEVNTEDIAIEMKE
jgi:hypothetical protein